MVSSLLVGAVLSFIAWLALQIVVFHGKYVTEKIAAGEYRKGPFRESRGETDE